MEWSGVEAIATAAAFIAAAGALLADVKVRRQAQARMVYVRIEDTRHLDAGDGLLGLPRGWSAAYGDAATKRSDDGHGNEVRTAAESLAQVVVEVHNDSAELLPETYARLFDPARPGRWVIYAPAGPIPPRSSTIIEFTVRVSEFPAQPSIQPAVGYRDASGRWWYRRAAEPITPLRRKMREPLFAIPTQTRPGRARRAWQRVRGEATL